MIRTVIVKGTVQIHINVTGLNRDEKTLIQTHANIMFNQVLRLPKPKPLAKKPWYKFW